MYRYFLIGWVIISSSTFYLLNHSKDRVIDEVTAAVDAKDLQALAGRVNWDEMRGGLKTSIAGQKQALKQYMPNAGPADDKISPVVDYYVQPENIAILYYYHEVLFPKVPAKDFIDSAGYYPPFGFQVTLGYPKNLTVSDPSLALVKDRIKIRLVFRLDGLTWKASEMHVPVTLVPHQTYDQPAVKLFGPP